MIAILTGVRGHLIIVLICISLIISVRASLVAQTVKCLPAMLETQGKLEVLKQEMARVNIYILGFNKLKWTGMGELNSYDHYIYYCGQESLRRHGVALLINKRAQNAVLGCNLKDE